MDNASPRVLEDGIYPYEQPYSNEQMAVALSDEVL